MPVLTKPNRSLRALSFALCTLLAATAATARAQEASPAPQQNEPFEVLPVEAPPPAPARAAAAAPLATRDGERSARETRPEPEREWYGWQTLSADGTAIGVMLAGAMAEAPELSFVGFGGFLVATPIIHGVHHGDWMLPSLAMRVGGLGVILGGVAIAVSGGCFSLDDGPDPAYCSTRQTIGEGVAIVGFTSLVSSIVLDAVFARSEPQRPDAPSFALWSNPATRSAGVSLTVVQ